MKRSRTFSLSLIALSVLSAMAANLCGMEAAKAGQTRRAEVSRSDKQVTRAEAEWVEDTVRSLSLRERIGQLIVTAASSEYMNLSSERFAEVRKQIEQNKVGGIIIRGGSPNDVSALTNEMQHLSKLPLLIAADYERGLRMQMKNGTPFTTNMGVGAAGDPQAAYLQGRIIAEEMRAMGVNWLYAPVADINNNPDNPVINIRSFGEDPARVAAFVAAAVRGVRK